jgi:hypothetical protein
MKKKSSSYLKVIGIALLSTFFLGNLALAHSGGTNDDGCHYNRKTGDYHCH